ncbi:HAD domain-containing protein [Actinomadura sp. 7K534]|uniref:HAD domain-containing protein n=1 Tax=Actinomadura sp. 7K534 TaxID=2530366 RepID=UPI001FB74C21|nr:HAD domain-containing protein [Actinomadura sp. 7K534]
MISGATDRPLIFLDVDGPLIPLSSRPAGRRTFRDEELGGYGNPLLHRLDPDEGQRLLALNCELVWATTWTADANEVISTLLGLPELPVVEWPDTAEDPPYGLHWKTEPITEWAAVRPFIWLDDELTEADRQWVASHHGSRALLHRVDPHTGLTKADYSLIRRWLAE